MGADFSPQIGVNDNRLWRYDDEGENNFDKESQQQKYATPFIIHASNGFRVDEAEEGTDAGNVGKVFLDMVLYGIGVYEGNARLTTAGVVRPGSVLNYLY